MIEAVIRGFASAADERNVERAASVLYAEAHQYALTLQGLLVISISEYLSLLEQGKIGGRPRTLTLEHLDVNGSLAVARVVTAHDATKFDPYFSLMQENEE